jgi:DNA-binding XRE family transcriptional regulator
MKNEPKKSRTAAGHTQAAAAALLGVAYRTWQDWEHGVAEMPAPLLRLYRHLAGVERIPFKAAS